MSSMTMNDVKGPTRYWTVGGILNSIPGLTDNDRLVFNATAAKIARVRPGVGSVDDWGTSLEVTTPTPSGCDLELTADHASGRLTIQFKRGVPGASRATHGGSFVGGGADPAGTWEADEGP